MEIDGERLDNQTTDSGHRDPLIHREHLSLQFPFIQQDRYRRNDALIKDKREPKR
jgi:hypothetical protein